MKNYLSFIVIIATIVLMSCEKYLDVKTNSKQVFITNLEDCQRILDNYYIMNTGYPSDGEASANDYFLDEAYQYSDFTDEDRDVYNWESAAVRASAGTQWTPCYFKIYNCNLVLETLDKLGDRSDRANSIRGSALFIRSFCLWQIAQLYAKPYTASSANIDLGIPIRLRSDINEKSSRGTVQDTYNQIIKDLKESVDNLPVTSSISSRPNKAAAFAMLARIYLSMENYNESLSNATSALQLKGSLIDYNTVDTLSNNPFSRFNDEVLWHAKMNDNYFLYSSVDANYAKISTEVVNSYNDHDLRKKIFLKPLLDESGRYAFTGNYEPANDGTLFIGLAVDELYIIRAECYARAGNVTAAMADLNVLLRNRWDHTFTDLIASNAEDALVKILAERRKELLMRGQRWTDLRRLNKDTRFAVTLSRPDQMVTLPPNDNRYVLAIPTEVIQNSGIPQNPR